MEHKLGRMQTRLGNILTGNIDTQHIQEMQDMRTRMETMDIQEGSLAQNLRDDILKHIE